MTQGLFSRRSLTASGLLAGLLSVLAVSPALAKSSTTTQPVDTSACSDPQLSQPFLSAGDANWYTLAPGESADSLDATGWTLSGGAQVHGVQLDDGTTGSVLDLPSGASATTPPMCVSSDFPTARTMVRDVTGDEGIHIAVAYAGTKTESKPKDVGQVRGKGGDWTLSDPFNVHPGNVPGWQLVRFSFVAGGKSSDFQIYDFYVDPRMRG
jgi:hypothetical protein